MPQFAPNATVQSPRAFQLTRFAPVAGSDLMGFSAAYGYAAGTIGEFARSLTLSGGSNVVQYTFGATGSVARSTQARLRETVYAADFGVVADGVTDDGPALQLAVNAAAGREIILPAGSIRISTNVNYVTSGNTDGLRIRGKGMRRTTLLCGVAAGYALTLDGSGTNSQFAFGASLRDFSVALYSATATASFCLVRAQWHPTFENLRCEGITGDMFTVQNDTNDGDSTAYARFCNIYAVANRAFLNCLNPGSSTALSFFEFDRVHAVLNTNYGARLFGLLHDVFRCSFAYNGASGAANNRGGIVVPYTVTATPLKGLTVRRCEFDANVGFDIDLQAVQQAEIVDIKTVYAASGGNFIRIGDSGAAPATDVDLKRIFMRPDGVGVVVGVTLGTNADRVNVDKMVSTTSGNYTQVSGFYAGLTGYAPDALLSMDGDIVYTSAAGATGTSYVPNYFNGKHHRVFFNGASLAVGLPTNVTTGGLLIITLANSSAGARTPTFDAAFKNTTIAALAPGAARTYTYRKVGTIGAEYYPVSISTDFNY